ncbi:MAG: hypothetical protein U1F51_04110 [Burkholderiales bacterium]
MAMIRARLQHLFPVVCCALTLAAFYPGHVSFDSAFQFWQARTGQYANLSPVAMTGLWALVHRVWPGSGGLFTLHVVLYWAGVWLAACALFDRPLARILAAGLASVATPAHLIVIHLWTDASLIAALGLATALVARADATGSRRPLAIALPLLVYGGLVRHNALPALLPRAAGWWIVRRRTASPPAPAAPLSAATAAVVAVVAVFGVGRALDRALVVQPMSTFGVVQLWDLAAVSVATDTMLVPEFVRPEGLTLAQLRPKVSRYANVPLYGPPYALRDGLADTFTPEESRALWSAWFGAITGRTGAYLAHRLSVATALFGRYRDDRPSDLAFVPFVIGYADNPTIVLNDTRLHTWAIAHYRRAVGWWLYAPVVWILASVAAAIAGWRWRGDFRGRLALASAVSGLLYVAPLPLVAPSTELRYCGWLFAGGTLAALALASLAAGRRTTPPASTPSHPRP